MQQKHWGIWATAAKLVALRHVVIPLLSVPELSERLTWLEKPHSISQRMTDEQREVLGKEVSKLLKFRAYISVETVDPNGKKVGLFFYF
jgi:hypothetical protein